MCSISVCSFELIVWKLWPEQKFKVKSWLIQKSRADNYRRPTEIQILRVTCTTRHHRDSFWKVSNNSEGNCTSCAHKKLLMDIQGHNIIQPFWHIKGSNCSFFMFRFSTTVGLKTKGTEAPVSLHRPDFSVMVKRSSNLYLRNIPVKFGKTPVNSFWEVF